MPFAHRKFPVYQNSLDFLALAHEMMSAFPAGYGYLSNQFARAASSITLNIAEGAGKFSGADKKRFYMIALGSAAECSAIIDVALRLKLVEVDGDEESQALLDKIASMLTGLAKSMDARSPK